MIKKLKICFLIIGLNVLSVASHAANISAYQQSPVLIKTSIKNENLLILATGSFDPLNQRLSFSGANINNIESKKYGIVQFHNNKSDFKWLKNSGFKVLQNYPNNAFLVNWSNQDKNRLDSNKDIRWYGSFQSGFKISPNLWSQNRQALSTYQLSLHTFKGTQNFNLKSLINKYVPNVSLYKSNIPEGFNQYTIEVLSSDLNEVLNKLSAIEDIQWIEPFYAQEFYNNEAVSATQAASIPVTTPIFNQGLFGTGQIVGVADSGLDRNEDWFVHLDKGAGVVTAITDSENVTPPTLGTLFLNNKVIAYWTMPGAEAYDHSIAAFHGTHVTGSVAGDRRQDISTGATTGTIASPSSSGYDNDDGMAPNAQILFNDLGSSDGLTGIGSIPMWEQAFAAGAAIHSNSYGSRIGTGSYIGSDHEADQALRELDDMIILFAAGNSSNTNTIGSPGNAKNVLTVGALEHGNSNLVAGFSSKGPTDDGRLKPDISATGTDIQSAGGDTNNTTVDASPSRRTTSGTSMATPITAGSTALLRQYFTDGFYPTGFKTTDDIHTPSGALMKAMLLNGTNTDGGFFNNNIGWGRVWLENSLYFNGKAKRFRFWEITNFDGLKTGEQFSVDVSVQPGEEFRATLVWYDLPGPTGSGVTLVNNLNLTVHQGVNTYLANNFSANNSTISGVADAINTVEQVRFSTPVAGTYTITVDANNIPGNGSVNSDKQGFALVVSGDLSSGNSIPPNPVHPSSLTAISNGLSGIDLAWSDVSADYDNYEIYRVAGSCANADLTTLRYLGGSNTNSFTDTTTIGGYQYSYKVRAFSDDLISDYSNCIDAISQQACLIQPEFNQNSLNVISNKDSLCQIKLGWDDAVSSCPAATSVKYNIYRSTAHDFTPDGTTLLATTASNVSVFTDTTILPGQTYYYVVKAEDSTSNGLGPHNGNETIEIYEVATTGFGNTTLEGNLIDDVDSLSIMKLNSIWSISAEQSSNGLLSYRSAIEGSNTYTANTCASMYSTPFEIPLAPASAPNISYQTRYNVEADWDGVVVEISTNGGQNWIDLPPNGGYPSTFSETGDPPVNVCRYTETHGAFNGSTGGTFQSIEHDLTSYQGQTVQIRWNLSTDPGAEEEGFYLDQLNYNNILVPQACTLYADEVVFENGFEN